MKTTLIILILLLAVTHNAGSSILGKSSPPFSIEINAEQQHDLTRITLAVSAKSNCPNVSIRLELPDRLKGQIESGVQAWNGSMKQGENKNLELVFYNYNHEQITAVVIFEFDEKTRFSGFLNYPGQTEKSKPQLKITGYSSDNQPLIEHWQK